MRIAILFDNFGPYHLARLHVAAQVCELTAVEIAGSSAEYAWEGRSAAGSLEPENKGSLKCVTLFQQGTSLVASQQELTEKINQVLDDCSPQAVFIPGWASRAAFVALKWCVSHKIPAIMMSESTEWDEARSSWRETVKRRIINLCSAALVGGQPHQEYMTKLGMLPERIFMGYDVVDNDYFSAKAQESKIVEEAVRRKFGLPNNYFLASARFIEKKNLARLLEAYSQYRRSVENSQGKSALSSRPAQSSEEGTPWDLVLLGDGELKADVLALQSSLGLEQSLHLPGFIQYPDLPVYYGLANAFVHASTTEQWGLVVNEAMASGLPVLVSNRCGCAQNLVQDGVNGFAFDPYNVEQLTQLMIKMSDSQFPLTAFGDASSQIISEWGSERYGSGLQAASEMAIKVGPRPAGPLDQMMLTALISK